MKILDRFRSQPEWRSDDPAVRASAVRALTNAEQDLLLEIARHDDAPGVRRAAIERLTDAALIAELLGSGAEPDPDVRAAAVATARDLLIGAADAAGADAVLGVLPAERDVAAVARLAVSEAVSGRAVARLTDAKLLGGVARRAKHPEVAREALGRLADRDELLTVVLKADDKAIALSAFDRLAAGGARLSADALADIARRASQKAVARRARSELAAREASGPAVAPPHPATAVSLCEAAEALAAITDLETGRREIEALVQRWAALDEPGDAAVASRFAAARRAAEDRLLELDRAASGAREAAARRAAALAPYVALCERVERSGGPLALDQLRAARDEWEGLTAPAGDDEDGARAAELDALARRFAEACEACERRYRAWAAEREHLQQLETATAGLEALASPGDAAAIRARWPALDERWRAEVAALGSGRAADAEVAEAVAAATRRRAAAEETKRAVEARAHADDDRRLREKTARLERQAAAVEAEATSDKLQLADAERHLRRTRQALEELGSLASSPDRAALGRRLRNAQTALVGRVRELRDFADWQRWANLGVQEELCREMEALGAAVESSTAGAEGASEEGASEIDEAELARKFRDLIDRWRQSSDVPKDRGDDLWRRFKAAHDVVYPRCESYFEAQRSARAHDLRRLQALAEEAERLSESTDWIKTAQRLTALQAEWKALGPVPRREQRALWKRFHGACSRFFTRRKADLAERKKVWATNLEQKEALCARIEALAETTDVAAAMEEVKRTQREWRTIGAVRRTKSDALWQRFREACEAVVDRSREGDRAAAATRIAAREALCAEIEALLAPEAPAATPESAATGAAETTAEAVPESPEADAAPDAAAASAAAGAAEATTEAVPESPAADAAPDAAAESAATGAAEATAEAVPESPEADAAPDAAAASAATGAAETTTEAVPESPEADAAPDAAAASAATGAAETTAEAVPESPEADAAPDAAAASAATGAAETTAEAVPESPAADAAPDAAAESAATGAAEATTGVPTAPAAAPEPPPDARPAAVSPPAPPPSAPVPESAAAGAAEATPEAVPESAAAGAAPDAAAESAAAGAAEATTGVPTAPAAAPEPPPDARPAAVSPPAPPPSAPVPAPAEVLEPAALVEVVRGIQARWRQAPDVPADDRRRLAARFGRAVARLVEARPEAFRDTDLDPARQLKQLERLCERAEALLPDEPEGKGEASPAELLARRWREQLASNTMGVRVDEGARRRAAIEEVKRLQVERRRLGSVPGEAGRRLGARFQRACDRALQRSRSAAT